MTSTNPAKKTPRKRAAKKPSPKAELQAAASSASPAYETVGDAAVEVPSLKPVMKPLEGDERKKWIEQRAKEIGLAGHFFAERHPEIAPTHWHGVIVKLVETVASQELRIKELEERG